METLTEPTSQKIHFKISGESVTNLARTKLQETGWEDALHFLTQSINGIDAQIATDVISGQKKFTGINNLTLVNDDSLEAQEHANYIRWLYAGTVREGDKYFRPYAFVDNWGWKDISSGGNNVQARREQSPIGRTAYYMNDQVNDRAYPANYQNKNVQVLWEEVKPIPFWFNRFNNTEWKEALTDWLSVHPHGLEHRGHNETLTENEYITGYPGKVWSDGVAPLKENAQEKPPKSNTPAYPPKPTPDTAFSRPCGWITPDGKFYGCEYAGHNYLAEHLIYYNTNKYDPDASKTADKLGWVRITYSMSDLKTYFEHNGKLHPTPEQRKAVLQWCEKHEETPPTWTE